MKARTEHFLKHMSRSFYQCYLISGNELFLKEDCLKSLIQKAQSESFETLHYVSITHSSDWQTLAYELATHSLFAEKKCIVCRFKATTLTKDIDKDITEKIKQLPKSTCLYFLTDKLTAAQKKKQLIHFMTQKNAHLTIWPLDASQLLTWAKAKTIDLQLTLDHHQLSTLIDNCHNEPMMLGNALDILSLSYQNQSIPLNALEASWGNQSSQSVFNMIDMALLGKKTGSTHAFLFHKHLASSPLPLLYLTIKTLNDLIAIKQLEAKGQQPLNAIKQVIKWPIKQPLFKHACHQHTLSKLEEIRLLAGLSDQTIKGLKKGNAWHQLELLLMTIAEPKLFPYLKATYV